MGGSVTLAVLQAALGDYRVVSWGVRVRNIQPPGTAVGMLDVAQVPAARYLPGYDVLTNYAMTVANIESIFLGTIAGTGTGFTSLLNLPDSDEFAVQELMANDLLIVPKIVSPEYANFLSTPSSANGTATQIFPDPGGEVFDVTAKTLTAGTRGDASQMAGRSVVLLHGRGFPNSTSILDIEVIYHIEGTPLGTSTALTSGAKSIGISNPTEVSKEISKLSRQPCARIIPPFIMHHGSQFVGGAMAAVNARLGLGAASAREEWDRSGKVRRIGMIAGQIASNVVARKVNQTKRARKLALSLK